MKKDFETRTGYPYNGRLATCVATDELLPEGMGIMVGTSRCRGGKAISIAALDEFIKTGKIRGSLHRPDSVTERHNISMEFSISVPAENACKFAVQLAVEGWTVAGKINQVTYKVIPAKPFLTCRGLQKALKTFDDIVGNNGGKITKFSSVVDGIIIPEYRDCFYYYQQVDETCRYRKTAEKKSALQLQNEARLKTKKKAVKRK